MFRGFRGFRVRVDSVIGFIGFIGFKEVLESPTIQNLRMILQGGLGKPTKPNTFRV